MPAYEEKFPRLIPSMLFIGFAFLMIYAPWQLGDRELYWRECDYAAMVKEISFFFPLTLAHGELIPSSFPLFPWLVSLLNGGGIPMELSLRLVSVISLLGITIMVWEAGKRAVGVQTGIVAAAVMASSLIVIEKTMDGYPNMLALLFLFAGWLAWFTFGVVRGKWNKAWAISCTLCGLAFYTIGWEAVIYFFLPLFFMRRPLTVWTKLKKPGFFAGIVILLIFVLIWGIPRWHAGLDIPFREFAKGETFGGYWKHLLMFPLEVPIRFMPWTLIAWAPFCVAYHPLDKNPIFSRFLRTIFISLFFLLWFSPFTRSRDILILAPPLAVMTGINYWLLIRRHAHQVHNLLHIFSYVMLVGAGAIIVFYVAPAEGWENIIPLSKQISFQTDSKFVITGLSAGGLLAILGLYLLLSFKKYIRLWEHILIISMGAMLIFWAIIAPYQSQERKKNNFGNTLKTALGDNYSEKLVIYKDKQLDGLYGECFYLGCNIKKIHSFAELPEEDEIVYLLSTEVPSPVRSWTDLLPQRTIYKGQRFFLWKGVKENQQNSGAKQ